ncbi:hypothetical protein N7474_005197 [Penicillium riverlandense]|uniref:uncharacterized protein n=1 Tax=Penicillium riverlandense TaxID=1903569 RepID=UPI00254696F7|nr:uncharacterized protein N7474_005197 [Penicillium riverlandense]KAJ5819606.1 hypothetical protein N7474_005197 [Penicillium riverlandense]
MFRFPTLAVDELPLPDIERVFHLTQADHTDWSQFQTPFEIPENSRSYLSTIDTSISNSDGIHEIALQQRLVMLLTAVYSAAPKDPRFPGLTKIPISGKWRFSFQPIVYEGELRCLQGSPDYSLWYHPGAGKQSLAVSLIILEAKKGQSALCVPQALAYMGMIHTQRRYEHMIEHTVFGLSTDNNQFHFLQINTHGEWSQLDLDYSNHRQEIVETLAYFHRQASILSTLAYSNGTKENHSKSQVEGALLATEGSQSKSVPDEACSTLQVEDHFIDDWDSDGTFGDD